MQTHLWWMSGVDICKIVSKFLHALESRHPDCTPWYHSPESRRLHKAENTDNLFDYQCLSSCFGEQFPLSKWSWRESNPRPNTLQKCFLHAYPLDWFSSEGWSKAKPSFGLSSLISNAPRGGRLLSSLFRCLDPDVGRRNFRGDSFVTNFG